MESKTIVITGASSGIGAALAGQLGAQGHRLILAARRKNELEAVARQVGNSALAVVTDVTRRSQVERLRDRALAETGTVDVWINNAGRGIGRQVLDLTDEDLDEMMAINVKSALYGMQAIVPHFQQKRRGHLINVSSFLGRVPLASHRSAYSAAKAALNVLTTNLRMDLAETYPEVYVSLVMPGLVSTEFAQHARYGTPDSGNRLPSQTPEEVAQMIGQLIVEPRPELYTNPASAELVRTFYQGVHEAPGVKPRRVG